MPSNIRLLRASLCANDWIRDRVALYGTGLGTKWVRRAMPHHRAAAAAAASIANAAAASLIS